MESYVVVLLLLVILLNLRIRGITSEWEIISPRRKNWSFSEYPVRSRCSLSMEKIVSDEPKEELLVVP